MLLRQQGAWRHRRVEIITVLTHEQVRRHVSIDFTVPEDQREGLRLSAHEFAVPLALLAKRPLVHFDLRNEEQHSIPLLTAEQHRTIARELLYRQLDSDLADQDAEPVALAAGELIEAVLADEPQDLDDRIRALEDEHGVDLADFRGSAAVLSRNFILWAVVRGLERRRVFKFAFDEPLGRSPNFIFFIGAPGCTEALSYHARGRGAGRGEGAQHAPARRGDGHGAQRRRARHRPSLALLRLRSGAAPGTARGRDRLRRRARALPRARRGRGHRHRPARRAAVRCSPTCKLWPAAPVRRSASCCRRRPSSRRSCCAPTSIPCCV